MFTDNGPELPYVAGDEGVPAEGLFEILKPEREPYLERFRECAKLSDRTLSHWPGTTHIEAMVEANQSTGARGVDFLTSSLLISLFPPNIEVVRLEADPVIARVYSGMRNGKVKLDSHLALYSEKIADEVDQIQLRGPVAHAIRHLLVGGNSAFYLPKKGFPRSIPLECYVQERDSFGRVLLLVICEQLNERTLPPQAREALKSSKKRQTSIYYVEGGDTFAPTQGRKKSYCLYTVVRARPLKEEWDPLIYDIHQEIEDVVIPGSYGGPYDEHTCPFMSFGYEWVGGEHYARSRVERYSGNLNSIEGLSQVVLEGAAAISKVLFGVDPNGFVSPDDLVDSRNCDVIPARVANGIVQDVGTVQTGKAPELGFAKAFRDELAQETSRDFGLTFQAPNRDRVTAEEIRVLAEQLDRGLGGIYSHFSMAIQRPVFERVMYRIESRGEAPVVPMREGPKQVLRARIITGLEALGRGNDAVRLRDVVTDLASMATIPPQILATIDSRSLVQKFCLARGVNPEDILLSEEEIEAQAAQAKQDAMAADVAPELVRQGGNLLASGLSQRNGSAPAA